MKRTEMLDYSFGLLEEPRRSAFDRLLANDPDFADQVARLGSAIHDLVDDGDDIEPPPGLASRTIAAVEQRKARPQLQDFAPTRVPFRWTDVAVAATVFLAGVLTLAGPLLKSRSQMDQASCADNLRKLGLSLIKYASTHGTFPFVPTGEPVGSYGVMLNETHDLTDPKVLACPCTSKMKGHAPLPDDYQAFRKSLHENPEDCREAIRGNFAYNTGYHDKAGVTPIPCSPVSVIPIASDSPQTDGDGKILEGNSLNHEERGQNVLFSDGHVSWKRNRWMSHADRDIFLNANLEPARGVHANDSSLVISVRPVSD